MNRFSTFIIGLAVTFGLPWLALVVVPYAKFSALEPVPYNAETDGQEGLFPAGQPGIVKHGQEVFRREGCVNCHTQVIRPDYAGEDSYKQAFGKDPENRTPAYTRPTLPYDYLGDDIALIGQVRIGPDLSLVGYRRPDAAWHHLHLYHPQSVHLWSTMPSFRHLYEVRQVQGQPSESALALEGDVAPPEGYEVVPTYDAEALVGYLMSLKKDQPLPAVLAGGGDESATPAAAAPAPEPAAPAEGAAASPTQG